LSVFSHAARNCLAHPLCSRLWQRMLQSIADGLAADLRGGLQFGSSITSQPLASAMARYSQYPVICAPVICHVLYNWEDRDRQFPREPSTDLAIVFWNAAQTGGIGNRDGFVAHCTRRCEHTVIRPTTDGADNRPGPHRRRPHRHQLHHFLPHNGCPAT